MVLELPGGLFGQEDVRETPTSTSAVTGTQYWSCPGVNFKGTNPDTDALHYTSGGIIVLDAGTDVYASVNLPNGAVITAAIVYGTNVANTWQLRRKALTSDNAAVIGTASVNTEDTSISTPTIDNSTYAYFFVFASSSTIRGARITYEL